MKNKIIILTAVAAGFMFLARLKQKTVFSETSKAPPALQEFKIMKAQIEEQTKSQVEALRPIFENASTTAESVLVISKFIQIRKQSAANVFGGTQREIWLNKMLVNPKIVNHAVDILTNLEQANLWYGNEQAEARMTAIDLLSEMAKQGNSSPIFDALKQAGDNFKNHPSSVQGAKRDIEDLLIHYFFHSKSIDLQAGILKAKELGITPELRTAFVAGITHGFKDRYSFEQIERALHDNEIL